MQIVIDIPKRIYDHILRTNMLVNSDRLEVTEAIINGTPLPKCTTNGDMIKAIFPEVDVTYNGFLVKVELEAFGFTVEESWWNAPYKGSEE